MESKISFCILLIYLILGVVLSAGVGNGVGSDSGDVVTPACQAAVEEMLQFTYPNATEMIEFCGLKMNDMGNIDECLTLPSNVSQYCVYSNVLTSSYELPYYIGLCYPAICTKQDVALLVPHYSLSPGGPTPAVYCYTETDEENANRQIGRPAIAIFIISGIILALVIIASTIDYLFYMPMKKTSKTSAFYHLYNPDEYSPMILNGEEDEYNPEYILRSDFLPVENPPIYIRVILAFSFLKNFQSFVTYYPSGVNKFDGNSRVYFDSMDGIRSVSMMWVILGHSLLFNDAVGYDNILTLMNSSMSFSFQMIYAGEFAVDVFFMLSGFLVCYNVLKQLSKQSFKSAKLWILYLVHRFLRLSPLYYYVLFLFVYVGPLIGYGPLAYIYKQNLVDPTCQDNLLPNIFYYNNLLSTGECLAVSWYLANDMQFYVIAILFFIAYKFNKKLGWALMSIVGGGSIIFTSIVAYKYKINPFFDIPGGGQQPTGNYYLTDIYEKPWFRISPYIVGMGYAILFYDHSPFLRNLYSSPLRRYIIYTLSFSITFILTFIPYTFYKGKGWNLAQQSIFNGLAHTAFPTAVGGFLLATFYGHGGVLKYFFELPIFKILTKLTYSTYLIHEVVIFVRVVSTTVLFHYSWIEYTYSFLGNLVISLFSAFVLHICVEKPFINLERLIFSKNKSN